MNYSDFISRSNGSLFNNLNDVGAFVWEQIDGVKSLQDIKDRLLAEYEVSSREAEDDFFEYKMFIN